MKRIKAIGIYDNTAVDESLIPGWGFSVLLSGPGWRILFDTGADLKLLSHNMEALGVSPESLDAIFLSHPHCDHIGGISGVLDKNTELTVYLTDNFPQSLKAKIEDYGADLVALSDPAELIEGVYTTGELTSSYRGAQLPEQGLIIDSSQGPLVVSGCAHPGIVQMVDQARDYMSRPPYLVLGGFHLGEKREEEVEKVVDWLVDNSIEKLAPTHCTGEKATRLINAEFRDDFFEFGAGRKILI